MTAGGELIRAIDVLIAEDDTLTRKSLRTLLERQGYTCAEAADGREAVQAAQRRPPRCVLLDLALSGMDGFAVARRLRADPKTVGTRIHCLTGRTDRAAREQARQAGCEAFLTKPIEPTRLLETVRGSGQLPLSGTGHPGSPTDSRLTEAGWLACTEPEPMLEFLLRGWKYALCELGCWLGLCPPGGTGRKLRLFACACLRRVWNHLDDPLVRHLVEVDERYLDGLASREEFLRAHAAPDRAWDPWAWPPAEDAAYHAADLMARLWPGPHLGGARQEQAALLRDLFGNPFRPAGVDRVWLTWNDGAIPKLAQSIHDQRTWPTGTLDPTRLLVLADALEEAGCSNEAILQHCRQPGEHTRGCWVVETVMGRPR